MEEKIKTARGLGRSLAEELSHFDEPAPGWEDSDKILQELQEKSSTLTKNEAAAKNKLEGIDMAGRALSSQDRLCPLAPAYLQCCLTQDQVDAVLETLGIELQLANQEWQDLSRELAQVRRDLARAAQEREENQARAKQALILKGQLNTQQALLDSLAADKAALDPGRHRAVG